MGWSSGGFCCQEEREVECGRLGWKRQLRLDFVVAGCFLVGSTNKVYSLLTPTVFQLAFFDVPWSGTYLATRTTLRDAPDSSRSTGRQLIQSSVPR